MTLDNYLKWFQSHERLLLVAIVMGLGAWGFNHWVDRSAETASNKAAVAAQVASVQHDADVKIAAAVAQQTSLFNQEQQAREQEMASLVAAMASRDIVSNNKIQVVKSTTTTPQAVDAVNAAYGVALPTPLTVDQAGSIPLVDLQIFTVAKLEGDTAKADLVDTQTALTSTQTALTSATNLVGSLQNQVTGLQTEIKTDVAASKAEIASVKASARKSKRNWFIAGFITGFVARQFVNF